MSLRLLVRWVLLFSVHCDSLLTDIEHSSQDAAVSTLVSTSEGYAITDPSLFNPDLAMERKVDDQRSVRDCFCGGSRHSNLWRDFHQMLHGSLAQDPLFSSAGWVHELCNFAYPIIFRSLSVDPRDDSFAVHSDCPAGVLAMVVVCAQSAVFQLKEGTLEMRQNRIEAANDLDRRWHNTPRVVLNEGLSVGDIFERITIKECRAYCEKQPACQSLSFGPQGCHLKARCVEHGEPMVPVGEQGADYETHYLMPCRRPDEGASQQLPQDEGVAPVPTHPEGFVHEENLLTMIGFSLRVLEFCYHCLDSSPWPFLLSEVLENYALAVESPSQFFWLRSAGRQQGPSTRPGPTQVSGAGLNPEDLIAPSLDPPAAESLPWLGMLPAAQLTLLRLQIRWTRGMEMEAKFWKTKLSPNASINDRLERLRTWMAGGSVTWFLDGDEPCPWIADARKASVGHKSPPRVLNVGSGPFAPKPLVCEAAALDEPASAGNSKMKSVPVIAADGLARHYLRIMDEHGLTPPFVPTQCPVEELHSCFPPAHFDVVHMRNALDHVFDPLLGIQRMLHVVRPGGWVLLRHARNEGVAGNFRNGLHQWAFDVIECPRSPARRADSECLPAFLIWNPELRLDVTSELLATGFATEVRTRLRDHPSDDAPPGEKYIWVEIRKPPHSA